MIINILMQRNVRWLAASAAVATATALSILFIDKPLALACAKLGLYTVLLDNQTLHLPVLVAGSFVAVLLGSGSLAARHSLSQWLKAAMLAGLALLWSYGLITFVLKPAIGRAVPTALLANGTYGFWPYHPGEGFNSFPSGHGDQAGAIISVLWNQYPAWRRYYVAAFGLLAVTLVIGEWHFLGDVIAGAAVGILAGIWTVRLWNVLRIGREA